jgi:hypothetical protein
MLHSQTENNGRADVQQNDLFGILMIPQRALVTYGECPHVKEGVLTPGQSFLVAALIIIGYLQE